MRVALTIRSDAESNPGGDYVQVLNTAEALRACGVDAQVAVGRPPTEVDLIHAFNQTRIHSTYVAAKIATAHGIPFVVSPIWHSLAHMQEFYGARYGLGSRFPIRKYLALKELYYEKGSPDTHLIKSVLQWTRAQRYVIRSADAVTPISAEEGSVLMEELGVSIPVMRPIQNAVDLEGASAAVPVKKENVVVCSGRIEPRKNTLSVVRAFKEAELPNWKLILLGAASTKHAKYVESVMDEIDGDHAKWIPHVPFPEAQQIYAKARILVLASFFEVTPLVGIEALHNGAAAVITNRSFIESHYGRHVVQCDPYDIDSIAAGLRSAARDPLPVPGPSFFESFSWSRVGEELADLYWELTGLGA